MKAFTLFFVMAFLSGLLGDGESWGATAPHTTRTVSGGGVTVKVTCLDPKGSNELRFQVVLDTHSVNLAGYDLKTITILRDDTGKNYLPTEIESKGSGHHREATVIFPKVASEAKRLEIVIKDIAGVKERTFSGNVE